MLLCQPHSSSFAFSTRIELSFNATSYDHTSLAAAVAQALACAQMETALTKTKDVALSLVPEALYGRLISCTALLVTQDADKPW